MRDEEDKTTPETKNSDPPPLKNQPERKMLMNYQQFLLLKLKKKNQFKP
jgi:hypothetical protein